MPSNILTIFCNKHIGAINETKQDLVNDQYKLSMHFFQIIRVDLACISSWKAC